MAWVNAVDGTGCPCTPGRSEVSILVRTVFSPSRRRLRRRGAQLRAALTRRPRPGPGTTDRDTTKPDTLQPHRPDPGQRVKGAKRRFAIEQARPLTH